MPIAQIATFALYLAGLLISAFLTGFMGYFGVRVASRLFGPLDINITSEPKQ